MPLQSKMSKEFHNSIKIKADQVVLELLIKTTFLTILIHNFKTTWPINSFDAIFDYLNNLEDAFCMLFFQECIDYFEVEQKAC